MRILILFLLTACVYSCTVKDKKPIGILPEEKMVAIYEDIRILEAAIFVGRSDTNININSDRMYKSIYEKHGTNSLMFDSSHNYYISKPFILADIFEKVEENLHERKARVDAKAEGGKSKTP